MIFATFLCVFDVNLATHKSANVSSRYYTTISILAFYGLFKCAKQSSRLGNDIELGLGLGNSESNHI